MVELILTLIIGIIGGTVALRFKMPAGAMVGSMMAVTVFSVVTGHAYIPQNIKIITQISAGAFIGASIKRKDVLDMKLIIKPAILMVASMITLDLFMGYIMFKVTGIDLITALFATAPAGIVDMSLISDDFGADTSKVVVLHLVRLVSVLIIFPPMMKYIANSFKNQDKNVLEETTSSTNETNITEKSHKALKNKSTLKEKSINLLSTTVLALAAGLIGYIIKVPAGTMTFSMAAVGAFNVIFDKGFMPLNLRRLTQMFAGALIGSRVTYANIVELKGILVPACILLIGIIAVNLFIGFLINKTSSLELITSLLASAPGGLSDMALIAKELGGDAPKIAILHTVRVITVIGIFPILIKIVTS